MKKGNVVELTAINKGYENLSEEKHSMSEELATAIQELIHRMQNLGPITQ